MMKSVMLLVPNGIIPLAVAWGAWRRKAWAPEGHVVVGVVLIGWIVVELLMIDYHWLQAAYLGLGVVILGNGNLAVEAGGGRLTSHRLTGPNGAAEHVVPTEDVR